MAWDQQQFATTLMTATDLSTLQYYFVKMTAGLVVACTGATDIPIGVLQNKPVGTAARPVGAEICYLGISKVNSNAALTSGDWIGPAADGQADAKTLATDATEFVCGRMLTTTTTAGAIGTAMINCITPHNAVTAN